MRALQVRESLHVFSLRGDGAADAANATRMLAHSRRSFNVAAGKSLITILVERWRAHPLAWIHRAEARAIGAELRAAGKAVRFAIFEDGSTHEHGTLLVRVSDAVMLRAADALSRAGIVYCGPGAQTMARCHDKAHAYSIAHANEVECPITLPATEADILPRPLILKPRRGSDSIGLRLVRAGPIPTAYRNADHLVQSFIRGTELTVGVLASEVGVPLRIALAEGSLYTFWRKYLRPPAKAPLADAMLAKRVRAEALRIAHIFGVDWAARIDFIHERATDRLVFLECDAAPLIGPASAFAASLAAAGMARETQLQRLLRPRIPHGQAETCSA